MGDQHEMCMTKTKSHTTGEEGDYYKEKEDVSFDSDDEFLFEDEINGDSFPELDIDLKQSSIREQSEVEELR